jgi:hypothetical protein
MGARTDTARSRSKCSRRYANAKLRAVCTGARADDALLTASLF